MVNITAWKDAKSVLLTGHGLKLDKSFDLTGEITVLPDVQPLSAADLKKCDTSKERASIETMHDIATFTIEVHEGQGGVQLANAGWASLWDFHLLSLASKAPCFILYSASAGKAGITYSVANRNLILSPLAEVRELGVPELEWARAHRLAFRELIKEQQFSSAMRYFGNAHYLFDLEHRIMLLWAGIEGLLQVDAEHSRRIALYSAILLKGSEQEKSERFDLVKKSYSLRSRVVHGAKPTKQKLDAGYAEATNLLADLLSRCVELGRVPTRDELDRRSFSGDLV
jgi:hypothetical protein